MLGCHCRLRDFTHCIGDSHQIIFAWTGAIGIDALPDYIPTIWHSKSR
jgi:hypothetical protein